MNTKHEEFVKDLIKEKWAKLILLVIISFISYYFGLISNRSEPSLQNYIFDSKTFFDNKNTVSNFGDNYDRVYIAGTLTGDGVGYKNNTTAITCYKNRMECLINSIYGIGQTSCQLGRLDSPLSIPIVKWDDYNIIATDENKFDTFSCVKTTISIDRKSEVVLWVQEPINQSQLNCKDFKDNKIYKWTIEDPLWMKDFKNNLKK